ncbi:MAG: four helix bundle protein [Candidatus Absconditabacterales bacterium]
MEHDILKRSLKFGIAISKYYLSLKDKKYFEVASQIFKSGTSIGANIREAQGGQSRKDFVNKMSIALKESYETLYWLEILSEGFDENVSIIKNECEQLVKILTTIVKNTKQNDKFYT